MLFPTWILDIGYVSVKLTQLTHESQDDGIMPMFLSNFMLPKRRFWKEEQKMISGFAKHFSMVRSPNRVLTTLKSASFELRISPFVHPSKNLR